MTKLLLSLHVLAALVTVGPVTVAASMFPPTLRRALGRAGDTSGPGRAEGPGPAGGSETPGPAGGSGDGDARVTLRTLHRICRVYAVLGVTVPVFGLATANSLGVLGDVWLITSIALTAAAAGVLALLILPAQDRALAGAVHPSAAPARLAMLTGVFNLLWATVTVLMIVRPGSTTGA
ncbi:hypothetical protein ACFVU3_03220 [Streptomyces sp. NPDC058052]|uniref:hypothetical protein n=1 Tax=Streptomyces sp. NPDC058052 TaxID=3346316 RepID=UPI0036EE7006